MHRSLPGLPYGGVEGFVGWAAASIRGGRRRGLSCFCVSGAGATGAQSTGQTLVCDACVGGRSLARARAWAGAATRLSYAFISSEWRAQEMFSARPLRIGDASQASPRVSERSPSGPTGLETNVSAYVHLYKNPRVKAQPVRSSLHQSRPLLRRGLASTAQQAWRLRCQVTQILPLGEQLCISVHWAVLQWPGSREPA